MAWIKDFSFFPSVVNFDILILLVLFFMGCPISAFERASMDWILSQGLLVARGFFSVCWYILV